MAQDLAEFLDALHGQRQNRNGSCGSHGQDGRPHCRPRFKVLAAHRASGMPFGDGYVPWHHPRCRLGFFRDLRLADELDLDLLSSRLYRWAIEEIFPGGPRCT